MTNAVSIGPATRRDAAHPRWHVLKPMRCIKILQEIPAMFCNGLRCLLKLRIAGKRLISSQRVIWPYSASNHIQPSIGAAMPQNKRIKRSTCSIFCSLFWNILAFQFSNGLQHCDGDLISFHVMCDSNSSVEYFLSLLLR